MTESLKLGDHEKRLAVPGDRIFDATRDLLIILSALAHASSLMVDGNTHKTPKPVMRVGTIWPDYSLAIPLRGPLEYALTERAPTSIEIGIITDAKENAKELPAAKLRTGGLHGVVAHITAPIFLMFFERYNDWLDDSLGKAENWPPTLNFARVVRNSIAHGKIKNTGPCGTGSYLAWIDLFLCRQR